MSRNMGRPVKNRYKVPTRQWDRWSNLARGVFNYTYAAMRPTFQSAYIHPSMLPLPRKHWETIRWNAAWTAADAVDA